MSLYLHLVAWLLVSVLLAGCSLSPKVSELGPQFRVETTSDPGFSMPYGGRTRSYFLHLPKGYEPSRRYPLLFVLHGGMGSGALIAERTGFNELADREGFIVVYPNGTGWSDLSMLTWNAGHCCFYARDEKVDDVGFISALLDKIQQNYRVDSEQIFATGFSNGGMLAYRVGAQLSERFRAVAVVSGNIGGYAFSGAPLIQIPRPKVPVSVLAIHGKADEQVAFSGGRGERTVGARIDQSVEEALAFWRQANDCDSKATYQQLAEGEVEYRRYGCPDSQTEVALYSLKHGRHAWPGGEKMAGWRAEQVAIRMLLDSPSRQMNASEVIWQFFSRQKKNRSILRHRRQLPWRLSYVF